MKRICILLMVLASLSVISCSDDDTHNSDAVRVSGTYSSLNWTHIYFSLKTGKKVDPAKGPSTDWDLKIDGYEFFTNSGFTAGSIAPGENSGGNGGSYFSGEAGDSAYSSLTIDDVDGSKIEPDRGAYFQTSVAAAIQLASYNGMTSQYDISGDTYNDLNNNYIFDASDTWNDANGNDEYDRANMYYDPEDEIYFFYPGGAYPDETQMSGQMNYSISLLSDPSDDEAIFKMSEGMPPQFVATDRIYVVRCADGVTYAKLMFVSHSYSNESGKWYTEFRYEILN